MNRDGTAAVPPLLMSIPDAAKVLGIGRSSFYKLLEGQKIESILVGGRRMIPEAAIREYVAGLRAAQRAATAPPGDDLDFLEDIEAAK
ncbi:helix-turn-helix domain-containing protein [Xanthobacter flavus]|uniref:helix-turn-helix domain-containing protein n=1 Tax=Xanthobacter flavus TaxID=281 RepID=UPI00372B23D6